MLKKDRKNYYLHTYGICAMLPRFMNNTTNCRKRKLQINILGKHEWLWTEFFLKARLRKLNIDVHAMEHFSSEHSELVVSGEKDSLWKFIKSARTPLFFVRLDKVVFTFVD